MTNLLSDFGLDLDRVSFRYGELWVLRETSLSIPRGGNLLVTGENGVGKSTLMYVAAGLYASATGRVLLAGQAVQRARPSEIFRRGVRRGFVFHSGGLLSNTTALSNVMLPLRYHADLLGLDEQQVDRRARELLAEMRVSQGDYHALPAHLSAGVRRRVSIARALAIQPNFLFFDDPDANLDSATRRLVYELLERFRDDHQVTLLVTTTNRELTERLGLPARELAHGYLLDRL
ncbi:MAG TPA: ATP-binding cassette domain-containing protein [Polyangiaceae bacterium]|nr:ATP-binding cassette domain-containing protein [Polyangiaceae bacterium]